MYITSIKLKNIKCFESEEITLENKRCSLLIAGNNGTGKSAILRSIAMGLCDRDSSAALLRELSGNFVKLTDDKEKSNEGIIRIDLFDDEAEEGKEKFTVETKITEYPEIFGETVTQTITSPNWPKPLKVPESFEDITTLSRNSKTEKVSQQEIAKYIPWINTFVTGYGPGLRTTGTARFTEYFAPDALYSIFKYSAPLQDPEIAWRRLVDAARRPPVAKSKKAIRDFKKEEENAQETSKKIAKLIHGVLGLDPNEEVALETNGIFIKIRSGNKPKSIELDARGDGHKALTKVILDILIWYLLFKNYAEVKQGDERDWEPLEIEEIDERIIIKEVRGIVIIDEVEQHLHPMLQRHIIKNLSEILPNVQFIMTTHSPLCLSGTADVQKNGKEAYKIVSLYKKEDGVCLEPRDIPYGLRADQILVDYFELPTTINVELQKKVDRLRELFSKEKLTREEQDEYNGLDAELKDTAPLLYEREEDRKKEEERDEWAHEIRTFLIGKGLLKDD